MMRNMMMMRRRSNMRRIRKKRRTRKTRLLPHARRPLWRLGRLASVAARRRRHSEEM